MVLDIPNADPDRDIAMLARQFLRSIERVEALQARVDRLEKALRVYANGDCYEYDQTCVYDGGATDILCDGGEIARTALNDTDGETGS